jgi:hypothetical protein
MRFVAWLWRMFVYEHDIQEQQQSVEMWSRLLFL